MVGKKFGVIFNSKRKLIMYKDGFISYSEKNNMSQVKQEIDPMKISEMRLKSNQLIIIVPPAQAPNNNTDRDSVLHKPSKGGFNYIFKFQSVDEAKSWYKQIEGFIESTNI